MRARDVTMSVSSVFWGSFEEALAQKTALKNFVIARDSPGAGREFATIAFQDIAAVMGDADPDARWYEVVTDGRCYLHLVLRAPESDAEREALFAETVAAVTAALPDVPGLAGMRALVSIQDGAMRVVYRDVVLGGLDAAREIAKTIVVRAESRPEDYPRLRGSVLMESYDPGHCVRLTSAHST